MAKECDSKTCDKSSCEGCASKKNPQSMQAAMNAMSNVKHVSRLQNMFKKAFYKMYVTICRACRLQEINFQASSKALWQAALCPFSTS